MPAGRPSRYNPKYCQELEDFFDIEPYREVTDVYTYKDGTTKETVKLLPNDMPFIRDFAKKIGVNVDTLYEWASKKDKEGNLVHPEFSDALKAVKQLQEKILVINGLNGCYNSTFAIFTAKNVIGWRDKTETELSGKDGSPIQLQWSSPSPTAPDNGQSASIPRVSAG